MSPFRDWVEENTKALMKSRIKQDLETHGLCVITQTYATRKCTLTAWNQKDLSVHLGFDIELKPGAKLGPEVQWFEGGSVEGWRTFSAEASSIQIAKIIKYCLT